MTEKAASILQKAQQERKRAQFDKALKRLEQGIAAHPDELDLYLEAIDVALDGGELMPATNLLKTVQDKFTRDRDRVLEFVRNKVETNHDPALARCVVEHAVKRRDLDGALALLEKVPDHTVRELLNRARTKAQTLKSASHGGYTVRGEAVSNEITNAVLSVRLGNLKEAMATLVSVVEERPVEHKAMDDFIAALAAKHPKSGRLRFARGCMHRAGGNEVEAIQHFLEGARLEPACAAACAGQLAVMLEKPLHPGKIRHALAEALLLKGDPDAAAAILRDHLAENPENGREVIMLVRPFIDPAQGLNACSWLAMEQALALEHSAVALEILRAVQQRGGHGDELFAWLEARAQAAPLPNDVMLFHGSLALDQKQYDRAAEILSDVCSASSQDVPAVLSMIDRHRSSHTVLDVLYLQYSPKETPMVSTGASDDEGFQTFEASEFRFESAERRPPAPAKPAAAKPAPKFNSSPFSSTPRNGDGGATARKRFTDANELSFDDDGAVKRSEEDEPMETKTPAIEITESHVTNVAQQLYLAGAAAFFHIDDSAADASTAESPAPAAPAAPTPEPAPAPGPEPFEARYQKFSRGELSNAAVIELLAEAVRDEHLDALHDLLYFTPQTSEEHFSRYYYQAEYHLMSNRPLQALEILARLDTPDLSDDDRSRVWYKIVIAQRMTHNYAGAASTLERLVEHFPGREDLLRLKRRNHEQFIESQSLAATTLEKTSSLD
ncbi:MAG TPA: hypothetical protein VF247_10900 [Candidatus Krumholzibacteria bacterium]